MLKLIPIYFFLFILPLTANAQVEVNAYVEPQRVTLEDEINLTITVEGSRKATEPALPSMPAFNVVSTGTTSSIQIINGNIDFRKTYNYTLIPLEEGSFTIGPISVFAEGLEYKSRPISITVGSGPSVVPAPAPAAPGIPGQNIPQIPGSQIPPDEDQVIIRNSDKPYWITAEVSDDQPYLHEQVLYTFRFYTRMNVGMATLTLPEFKDFWNEEVVPEKKYYKEIDGQRYVVSEKIVTLFPLRSGELEIGETVLRVEVPDIREDNFFNDPFFGFGRVRMKAKTLKAPPVAVHVKPLPPAPENFANVVGRFEMNAELSNVQIKTGESTTLTLTLKGRGNVKDARLPEDAFKTLPLKIYDDKPAVEIIRNENGIEGSKTFKRALVPTQPGEYEIPPLTISFFNPESESYETLQSPAFSLKVAPSENESLNLAVSPDSQPQGDAAFTPITEDIATIHTGFTLKYGQQGLSSLERIILLLGFAGPILAFLSIFIKQRRAARSQESRDVSLSRGSFRRMEKSLNRIRKTTLAEREALARILEAVRIYVGERLDIRGGALTVPDMVEQLNRHGVGRDLTEQLRNHCTELEAACYGMARSGQTVPQRIQETTKLMKVIDRKIRSVPGRQS